MLAHSAGLILDMEIKIVDMFQLGTAIIKWIASKMENGFWKQVLSSTDKFMQEAIFCSPERIFETPFWENPFITLNEKPISVNKFGTLGNKLHYLHEFYCGESGQKLTRVEINRKFRVRLTEEKYDSITSIIRGALTKVGISPHQNCRINQPSRPGLIEIANLAKKGTKPYYKILRKRSTLVNKIRERETKWHNMLGIIFSVEVWNKRYTQC